MLKLQVSGQKYKYSIFTNPVARVLKFEKFIAYFNQISPADIVLDYGAGDRPLEPLLKTRFKNYIAADYAPSNEAHQARPHILITDEGLDIESSSVDCVILTEVLEHIYKPTDTLAEIFRILKPTGCIIGTVPFAISEHEQPYDFHRYTSFCLRRMFEDSGFEVNDLEYVGDTIGVTLSTFSRTLGIISKILYKLKLAPLAKLWNFIIRIPEMIYYFGLKLGLNPARISYYRAYPMGFSFYVTKPADRVAG